MIIWYHGIGMGLFLSYIPNQVQTSRVWRHKNDIFVDFAQIADFQWNMGQTWIFRQKVLNVRISPGFLLVKEENGISNIYCKIQNNKYEDTMKIFFKIGLIIADLHPPLTLTLLLWRLTLPRVRWYPQLFFFIKLTAKGVKEITNAGFETSLPLAALPLRRVIIACCFRVTLRLLLQRLLWLYVTSLPSWIEFN